MRKSRFCVGYCYLCEQPAHKMFKKPAKNFYSLIGDLHCMQDDVRGSSPLGFINVLELIPISFFF